MTSGNYDIGYGNGTLTIDPATLYYVATPVSILSGAKLKRSSLTGTVTGFQLADTLALVTNGKPKWEAPQVSRKSPAGSYAIVGSKLRLKNHNYVFAQDSGNATALTIQP